MNDLKFAIRQLAKNPGFTAVAAVTLGLGLGANTAIFSVVNAVLLKPLPYRDPDRLMLIWTDNPAYNLGIHELPPSQRDLIDWRAQARSFDQIAAVSSETTDLNREADSTRIGAVKVTANFFSTLGIQPEHGRTFTADEEQPGKDKVVVLSHALWQREFGGNPNLVGTTISLNNERRLVVGIMPPGFSFPHSAEMPAPYHLPPQTDLWLPASGDARFWQDDINRQFIVLGRLKPSVTMKHAQVEMSSLAQRAAKERPATHSGWSTYLRALPRQVAGQTRPVLFVLLGAVGFVLLIACANVANLLLCQSAARRKEMAIRSAIGAGRGRVIRQLFTESLLLAALGGLVGLLVGNAGLKLLLALSPPNIPRLHEASLDGSVFAFSLAITLATGLLFGLVPAWNAAKANLNEVLSGAGRGHSASGRTRSFGSLVTAETAVAVLLLVGATLMLESLRKLLALDPGFIKTGVCSLDVTFRGTRYQNGEARIALFDQLRERLRGLPGIAEVGAISHFPLTGNENVGYFSLEGAPDPTPGHEPLAENRLATVGCFEAMGFKLLRGRDFDTSDGFGKNPVAIVNETLVHQFFPGKDPLGKRIKLKESNDWLTIIGVIADVRGAGLELSPRPAIYRDHRQDPGYWEEMTLVVRGAKASAIPSFEGVLRREIGKIDPTLPAANFRTIEGVLSNSMARPRFSSFLLSVFAATALGLTMIGLYGVVAYSVSQRTRELGIRVALGARRRDLLALVVGQGLRPALVGLAFGLAGAFALTRFLSSQLYEINPTDPLTLIGVSLVLLAVAMLACWVPARRAAAVDPVVALRAE